MPSSFFTKPSSHRKRKAPDSASGPSSKRRQTAVTNSRPQDTAKPQRRRQRSESISEGESESGVSVGAQQDYEESGSESNGEDETAAERRLRLAERYLDNIRQEIEIPEGFDAAEIDQDLIAERLKEDVAETKGKVYRHVANQLDWAGASKSFFTGDQNGVTAVAVCPPYAYTASKDGSVVKWEIPEPPPLNRKEKEESHDEQPTNITPRRKPKFLRSYHANISKASDSSYIGHTNSILCVAVSSSGKYLATGGLDKRIVIWDVSTSPTTLKPIKLFIQHRDAVHSLSFRRGTHQLFSASADRTIKIWSLDELAYIETLFGHQDSVVDVRGMPGSQECCVSVGARDKTARYWKVVEESQLVFRGGGGGGSSSKKGSEETQNENRLFPASYMEGSIDRIALLDTEIFITGSDNGSLSLWSIHRKKPVFVLPLAHGVDPPPTLKQSFAEQKMKGKKRQGRATPRWITALVTVPFSDVVLSGSWDGYVRAWRVSPDRRRIEAVGVVADVSGSAVQKEQGKRSAKEGEDDNKVVVRGFINDLAVFERGDRGKDGLCVVAGVSKEHRLGKWKKLPAKNGGVVFEVKIKDRSNGVATEGIGAYDRTSTATLK